MKKKEKEKGRGDHTDFAWNSRAPARDPLPPALTRVPAQPARGAQTARAGTTFEAVETGAYGT